MKKKASKSKKRNDGLVDATAEFSKKHGIEMLDHVPKKKYPHPPKKDKDGKVIPE